MKENVNQQKVNKTEQKSEKVVIKELTLKAKKLVGPVCQN